jgi:hypothetical protein
MSNANQARAAFERIIEDGESEADRERDARLVDDYIAHCEATFATLRASASHEHGEAGRWFAEASKLDTEIKGMRVEVRQSRAELTAIALAASTLCDGIGQTSVPSEVVALAADVRAALTGQLTEQLAKQIDGSVGRWEVVRLVRVMLKKMRVDQNIAETAESWFRQRVVR